MNVEVCINCNTQLLHTHCTGLLDSLRTDISTVCLHLKIGYIIDFKIYNKDKHVFSIQALQFVSQLLFTTIICVSDRNTHIQGLIWIHKITAKTFLWCLKVTFPHVVNVHFENLTGIYYGILGIQILCEGKIYGPVN